MPSSKIRFVTACQQVLALAAVLAVLTPAANVISLDVVHDRREAGVVTRESAVEPSAHLRKARQVRGAAQRVAGPGTTVRWPAASPGPSGAGSAEFRTWCCPTLKGSGPWHAPRRTSR